MFRSLRTIWLFILFWFFFIYIWAFGEVPKWHSTWFVKAFIWLLEIKPKLPSFGARVFMIKVCFHISLFLIVHVFYIFILCICRRLVMFCLRQNLALNSKLACNPWSSCFSLDYWDYWCIVSPLDLCDTMLYLFSLYLFSVFSYNGTDSKSLQYFIMFLFFSCV